MKMSNINRSAADKITRMCFGIYPGLHWRVRQIPSLNKTVDTVQLVSISTELEVTRKDKRA